jgi:hypothetical protein
MGKLVDCLEGAKRWYLKTTEETRRDYDDLFFHPISISITIFNALIGGVDGLMGSIAGIAMFGSAYHIGRELGNARGYRNMVNNCNRMWGSNT